MMRNHELERYRQLIEGFSKYPSTDGKLVDDASTVTFEGFIAQGSKSKIRSDRDVPYDVMFDVANTIYINTQHDSKNYSRRIYNGMMEDLRERAKELAEMSPEEFRHYKIGQMKLSEVELTKIREDASINYDSQVPKNSQDLPEVDLPNQSKEVLIEVAPEVAEEPLKGDDVALDNNAMTAFMSIMNSPQLQYPKGFQTSILNFLMNMSPVNVLDHYDSVEHQNVNENSNHFTFDSLNGTFLLSSRDTVQEMRYSADPMDFWPNYRFVVDTKDSHMVFTYRGDMPEMGTRFEVNRANPNPELVASENKVAYEGTISNDGEIMAKGRVVKVPNFTEQKSLVPQVIREFACDSYPDLINTTEAYLNINQMSEDKKL